MMMAMRQAEPRVTNGVAADSMPKTVAALSSQRETRRSRAWARKRLLAVMSGRANGFFT